MSTAANSTTTALATTKSVSDWSRSARKKRKLEKAGADPMQSHITDFFKILSNIEKLTRENEKLSLLLQQFCMTRDGEHTVEHHSLTPILKQIIRNAERNVAKHKTQRRHPEILKKFATALFIYAGPLAYEFIQQNMPQALPCLRSVQRAVHLDYTVLTEGSFRFDCILNSTAHLVLCPLEKMQLASLLG